jgi:hypothetical protein
MGKRKTEIVHIESLSCYGIEDKHGRLRPIAGQVAPNAEQPATDKQVRVRVLRESDYQRLVKNARLQ